MNLHHYSDKPVKRAQFSPHRKDPTGLYCFPEFVTTEHFAKKPYRYAVEISDEAQLDLESLTREEWVEFLDLAITETGKSPSLNALKMVSTESNFATRCWDAIREMFEDGEKFAEFWHQKMGYNSLVDAGGTVVLPGEPQIVALTKDVVTRWLKDENWPVEE